MNNPKLNAQNGAFGDTPGINPALETTAKPTDSTKALHKRIAQLEEQNRNLLAERSQRLEAEKAFGFIAGIYEQDHELNIKLSRDSLTLDEALALYMENMHQPFAYIQYKELFIIAIETVMEQAA